MELRLRRFRLEVRCSVLEGRRRKWLKKYQTAQMNTGLPAAAQVGCLGKATLLVGFLFSFRLATAE